MKIKLLNICLFGLLGSSTLLLSCNKQLTEKNPSGLTAEEVYSTSAGFETLVNAGYTYSRYWYGKEEGISYSEMGTDIWTSGTADANPQFAKYLNLQGSNVAGGTGTTTWSNLWNDLYTAVNLCNYGIANVGKVTDYSAAQKTTREAELRFLRAFYYWHIVETWGNVSLTTQPTVGVVTTATRSSVDDFYKQIFTDLQFAVANLPTTQPSDYGRAWQPVAKAFLARMYLTRNMNTEAIAMANDVINNYSFQLLPKFGDLWNMANLKNNKEVIWAIDYSVNLVYNDQIYFSNTAGVPQRGSNNAHMFYIGVYDQINTSILLRDINNDRPFNRFMPTKALLDMFDANNDSRYEGSFQTVWYANKAGNNIAGNTFAKSILSNFKVGDTVLYCAKTTIPEADMNSRRYTTYDISRVYKADGTTSQSKLYVSLKKFKDSTRTSIPEVQSARDVFVMRLAEMYLIAAEAEMKNSKLDSAAYYINIIRKRAAIPGHEDAMKVTASQMTLDFMLDERARELCGEQLRWFDLKRTGKLFDRITTQNMNPEAAANLKVPTHLVRPIPQSQLDAMTNEQEFGQNDGYQ